MAVCLNRVLLLTATLAVAGQNIADAQAIAGAGAASCGKWTAVRRDRQSALYEAWVLGFLSGVATEGETGDMPRDPIASTDVEGVTSWMDNFCRDNPTSSIMGAALEFSYVHPR